MKKVIIVGAGGIGRAVAAMLADHYRSEITIILADIRKAACDSAQKFLRLAIDQEINRISFIEISTIGIDEEFDKHLSEAQVILDCLPGTQAPRIAALAKKYHLHYANLTEYIKETNEIIEIAQGADTAFVLQTGLAPGFINVLAHQLYLDLFKDYQISRADSVIMRVGALPQNCKSPHYYGFTWSPVGVATEYLEDCIVIRNGYKTIVPALSARENLIIDNIPFEADLTSGGAADLPDYFIGKVSELDYKTLRYPGHYDWVKIATSTIPQSRNKIDELQRIMLENIPMVEEDFVLIYSAAQGRDENNTIWLNEKSYWINQITWGKTKLKAIQATTAAPMAEVTRMFFDQPEMKGPIFQSQIDPYSFMQGPFVKKVYGG